MSLRNAVSRSPPNPQAWRWGNIGFDTRKKLWFVDLYNGNGMVKFHYARNVIVKNGCGVQYQWNNRGEPIFWHVRERFFSDEVKSISYDQKGNLIIECSAHAPPPDEGLPSDYSYVAYAYSLKTSKGYIEFYDRRDKLIKTIRDRWILVEDLPAGRLANILTFASGRTGKTSRKSSSQGLPLS